MAQTIQKKRIVGNTGKRAFGSPRKTTAKKHYQRANMGEIVGFTLAGNPGRKGSTMAKAHKKKASHSKARGYSHSAYKGKKHHGNPGGHAHHKTKKYKHHKSNPGFGGMGNRVVTGAFVIAGAVGSKIGAQMVLGSNNVGLIGYAGNAAAGGVLWGVAKFFRASPAILDGLMYGTIVQIIIRAINDYTPFGQYVAQLGMGDYQIQSFVTPQILVDPWHNAEIAIPDGWAPRMLPAPAAAPGAGAGLPTPKGAGAGMGGLYGGGWGGGLYG